MRASKTIPSARSSSSRVGSDGPPTIGRVADESPLEHAAEIYAPFDAAEAKRLQQYVEDVELLADADFFNCDEWSVKLESRINERVVETLTYPGEKALHQIVVCSPALCRSRTNELHRHTQASEQASSRVSTPEGSL
jgi:hypothetical protein